MPVPPQQAVVKFFSPDKEDQGLIEIWNAEVTSYQPLDLGATHPNTREYPGFKLGKQFNIPNDHKFVMRVYVKDETPTHWFNYAEKFVSEANAFPIFVRNYRETRNTYTPKTKGQPLKSLYGLVLTGAGSGYTPGTLPALTFTGGGGSGAAGHALVNPDGTIAQYVLDEGGDNYTSTPTFTVEAPPSGTTATGTALLQPTSAVLIAEKADEFPDDSEFFGLYMTVTRVYMTLPGPPMVTRSIGQDNLTPEMYRRLITRIETTRSVNFQDYQFPGGLSGNETQVLEQQKTFIEAELKVIEEVIAITTDKILGGDTGEWGVIKIERSVVNEGDAVDTGFDVPKSTITPFGNGKGAKVTARATLGDFIVSCGVTAGGSGYSGVPAVGFSGGGGSGAAATAIVVAGVVTGIRMTNKGTGYTSAPTVAFTGGSGTGAAATAYRGIAIVTEQDYDQRLDLTFTKKRYLAPQGTVIGTPKCDVKALDVYRDEVVERGGNISVLDNFIYSMAGTTNIDMPDRLVGVQPFAEITHGDGSATTTVNATLSGFGSLNTGASTNKQTSDAAAVALAPQIKQFYGNEIACMFHHVYMLQGSTYANVRTHLAALLGVTVNPKPNFNPEVVQLVTVSRRMSKRTGKSLMTGITRHESGHGTSNSVGDSISREVGQAMNKTTVSPTIHDVIQYNAQAASGEIGAYGIGIIQATDGDTIWPSSGIYLWHIRSAVFKEGYVLFECLVIDASLFPSTATINTTGYYYYLPSITRLTGGTSTDLDFKNIATFSPNTIFEVVVDGRGSSQWKKTLWTGVGTPSTSANFGQIKPPDYNASTMNYVLIRERGW